MRLRGGFKSTHLIVHISLNAQDIKLYDTPMNS